MADAAVRSVLFGPTDVVEDGGQLQDAQVGLFLAADPEAEAEDALGVVPVVAAPGVPEAALGLPPDAVEQGFGPFFGFVFFGDSQLNPQILP
jgi:hypothetical protein